MLLELQFKISQIVIVMLLYSAICFIISSIFQHYSVYWIPMTALVAFWIFSVIVRFVGGYLMFPGSFGHTKSSVEFRESQYMFDNMMRNLKITRMIIQSIKNRADGPTQKLTNTIQHHNLMQHIETTLNLLQYGTKTQNKTKIRALYKKLKRILSSKLILKSTNIKLFQILANPELLNEIPSQKWFEQIQIIDQINSQIINSLHQYQYRYMGIPKTKFFSKDTIKAANWFLNGQKLFDLDSFYGYWQNLFQFSRFMVPLSDGFSIQAAIIHNQESKKCQSPHKAVIISLPNAAYMQQFAVSSEYVQFYQNLGYEVILWNYRGYGNSTGYPSLTKNMQDIQEVYRYCQANFHLKIQISHGCSIGSTCAISNCLQNQKQIKLLVTDRTFKSLKSTAIGFINGNKWYQRVLIKLSSLIFYLFLNAEEINFAQLYFKIKNRKVMIYSTKDEIISERASLRNGMLQNFLRKPFDQEYPTNKNKRNSRNSLNSDEIESLISEQIVDNEKKIDIYKNCCEFRQNMYLLYLRSSGYYHQICKLFAKIDYTGFDIQKISSSHSFLDKTSAKFKESCQYYYLNFFFEIPRLSNSPLQQELQEAISQIQILIHQCENVEALKSLQMIKNSIEYAYKIIKRKILSEKMGKLIVTHKSHNCSIQKSKRQQLRSVIQQAYLGQQTSDFNYND